MPADPSSIRILSVSRHSHYPLRVVAMRPLAFTLAFALAFVLAASNAGAQAKAYTVDDVVQLLASKMSAARLLTILKDGAFVAPSVRGFETACNNGELAACDSAAVKYEEGIFAPRDTRRAAELFLVSCRGDVDASCQRSIDLFQSANDSAGFSRTAMILTLLCDKHQAKYCQQLAVAFLAGHGVERDARRAGLLFSLVCDMQPGDACSTAASMLAATWPPIHDGARWATYSERACGTGRAADCLKVADALRSDSIVPTDLVRSGD